MLKESFLLFLSGISLTLRAILLLFGVCLLCPFFIFAPQFADKLSLYADDLLEECEFLKFRQGQLERKRKGN